MLLKLPAAALALASGTAASAQTSSVRDTATAYGARLTAKGLPANLNARRINNRNPNRIHNRLSLRVERYRPDNSIDPAAAFKAQQNDKTRVPPTLASRALMSQQE